MSLESKPNNNTKSVSSEVKDVSDQAYKVPTNKTLAWRFGLELVSVSVVGFIVLMPYLFRHSIKSLAKPERRGFFCDDADLKHPYLEETIRFELNIY